MIRIRENVNNRLVFAQISLLQNLVNKSIHKALYEIGRENVVHARNLMSQRKTGRIYIIDGKPHQASAPGEAPAILSGALFKNIDYAVRGFRQMEFGDKTQPGKFPYGRRLELGENIDARPHIGQTVKDKAKDSFNSFVRYAKRELQV